MLAVAAEVEVAVEGSTSSSRAVAAIEVHSMAAAGREQRLLDLLPVGGCILPWLPQRHGCSTPPVPGMPSIIVVEGPMTCMQIHMPAH